MLSTGLQTSVCVTCVFVKDAESGPSLGPAQSEPLFNKVPGESSVHSLRSSPLPAEGPGFFNNWTARGREGEGTYRSILTCEPGPLRWSEWNFSHMAGPNLFFKQQNLFYQLTL